MHSETTLSTGTKTDLSKVRAISFVHRRLPQFIICAGIGMIGGAIGVAVAIGLAIVFQLLLFPSTVFSPNVIQLTVIAILAGLGISWLLSQGADRILSGLLHDPGAQALQVVFVFSALTSLLQSFLFTHGL
jgi:hypothetical protein